MPKIITLDEVRDPELQRYATVQVSARRETTEKAATINVNFDGGSRGHSCTKIHFTPDEFKAFADEVQKRREWLGV
jgi:glutamine amidotransferase-like uncharacterized protein